MEGVLKVPAPHLKDFCGLAIDIGGSTGKFLYTTRDDHEKTHQDGYGHVHVLTCSTSDLDAGISKIKQDIHLKREPGKRTKVKTCGIGTFQRKAKLEEAFDIEIDNLVEGDCLLAGFKYYISVLPEREVLQTPLVHVMNATIDAANARNARAAEMSKDSNNKFFQANTQLVPVKERELSNSQSVEEVRGNELYPCIIAHLGSNHGFMLYHADGRADFCETSVRGGRCFMGVGSLLTGAQCYDELMDLAERGDNMAVDQSLSDILKPDAGQEDDPDDPYKKIGTETNDKRVAYMFGHAVFKDKDAFQPADLALAWLKSHMSEVAGTLHHHVARNNTKHVVVTGSLVAREVARQCLLQEFIQHDSMMLSAHNRVFQPEISFLRHGGLIQACGAMLSACQS